MSFFSMFISIRSRCFFLAGGSDPHAVWGDAFGGAAAPPAAQLRAAARGRRGVAAAAGLDGRALGHGGCRGGNRAGHTKWEFEERDNNNNNKKYSL